MTVTFESKKNQLYLEVPDPFERMCRVETAGIVKAREEVGI
jgi:hypothetical protein